jgi:guanylate kinase
MKDDKRSVTQDMGVPREGRLFVVSGPSGAGKTSLIRRFLTEDGHTAFSVSYTTRRKRKQEVEGKDYYFVSAAVFSKMIDTGRFLEWEKVHNHSNGTPRTEVMDALGKGTDILLDVDVKGALRVKEQCPEACLIFVEPPSKEALISRLSLRGEKEIDLRMKRVEEEIEKKPLFEYTVVNDNLETAYDEFKGIIEKVRRAHGQDNR